MYRTKVIWKNYMIGSQNHAKITTCLRAYLRIYLASYVVYEIKIT